MKRLGLSAGLTLLQMLSGAAMATGIDCAKDVSAFEKPACVGPRRNQLDMRMAQVQARAAPTSGTDFTRLLKDFRLAVYRNDGAAIASMTRLPFLYEGMPRDRRGFLAIYPYLFDTGVRRCLVKAVPVAEDGAQVLFCRPYAFYFRPVNGAWRLVEFGADGEDMP